MDILAIGNSFSQDATRYLHDMLADVGIPSRVVNLYIGGCSLQRHYANMQSDAQDYSYELNGAATGRFVGLHAALTERNWDVITFQQASHDSGIAESYYPYLPELLAYARSLCPMRDTCCIKPGHTRSTARMRHLRATVAVRRACMRSCAPRTAPPQNAPAWN